MTVCFLLYIEDAGSKSSGKVELFLNDEAAYSAMEADYARTLETLRPGMESRAGDCYCKCNKSFAVIVDGEDCYSWSVGQRKFAEASDYLAARKVLWEVLNMCPNRGPQPYGQ